MKTYISASRRTDIPRFFTDAFFAAWLKGEITYDGGYGRTYTVSLKPEDVLGYIFWSKDFHPFITHPLFEKLIQKNNAVFHFTINDCAYLEPRVAPLLKRIDTMQRLCGIVGPKRVLWRFDPICKYRDDNGQIRTNEKVFHTIMPFIKNAGIENCYFSFMTFYNKLNNRGVQFATFSMQEKKEISERLFADCNTAGIQLFNCCNPEVPGIAPGIKTAHCIDEKILRETDRFGVHQSLAMKPTREGCGCFESRDIGSYQWKCTHGCLYCYANPEVSKMK